MRKVTYVFAHLVFLGLGRRLQAPGRLQSMLSATGQKQLRAGAEDNAHLLRSLADMFASPPSAAFRVAGPSTGFIVRLGERSTITPGFLVRPGCSIRNQPVASSADTANSIAGVSGIADRYEAFLLDQFGVLHDGSRALPGAVVCFDELIKRGVRCVVLSNTSRRKSDAIKKLGKLGFDANALTGFICSGEEAWQHIATHCSGKKILWLGWEDDYLGFDNAGYLRGLDVVLTASPEEADYVLAQGTQLIRSPDGDDAIPAGVFATGVVDGPLKEALQTCQERGIPMLCANPDFQATQPDGSVGYMPGIVAEFYGSIGGEVIHFGKPFTPSFNACISLLDGVQLDRICHVGDSLHHDIQGANNAAIDSLFITTGIHKQELPSPTDSTYSTAVRSLCKDIGANPTFIAQDFVW